MIDGIIGLFDGIIRLSPQGSNTNPRGEIKISFHLCLMSEFYHLLAIHLQMNGNCNVKYNIIPSVYGII